jgi:hypothetical protein
MKQEGCCARRRGDAELEMRFHPIFLIASASLRELILVRGGFGLTFVGGLSKIEANWGTCVLLEK